MAFKPEEMSHIRQDGSLNLYAKIIGLILVALAVVIFVAVTYHNSARRQRPIIFSERAMLDVLWNYHSKTFLDQNNFRTVDAQAGGITTSEGQSYTMLRSVWWNDKQTFDKSWLWTRQNLQHTVTTAADGSRSGDHLFSWYYGKLPDGSYGVNTQIGGNNSASDADTDIALALIFARDRWGDQKYLDQAKDIIRDIWNVEVAMVGGKPYMLANNLEKQLNKNELLVNPSYIAPYAYKIFAKYDPANDWNGLADNSYAVLEQAMALPLDKNASANIPPNWVVVNTATGMISASTDKQTDTNYGFDAMRVPFRLALDWQWFKDPRDKNLLAKMNFFSGQWNKNHALDSLYSHDGQELKLDETPALYGGTIGYFMVADTADADAVYQNKLRLLFSPDNSWKSQIGYYDENWAWFGMALYNKFLTNLENP